MELKKATSYSEQIKKLADKNIRIAALPKMPKGEHYIPTRRLFAQFYMLNTLISPTAGNPY